jgi:hypothetical protein
MNMHKNARMTPLGRERLVRGVLGRASERDVPLHADPGLMAQSGGDLVLDPASKVPVRRVLHIGQTAQRAHRQLHRRLQRERQALRLEQVRSSSKASQSPFRGPMIPGTSCRGP